MVKRGEIWWTDLPEPIGSGPGFRRPVLVVQDDEFNQSRINTVVIAAITSNLNLAKAKGNVGISPNQSGLEKNSVINVSSLLAIDKKFFQEYVGILSEAKMEKVDKGLRLVLSLDRSNK
jgi:mRNA interferase MazF